jgi:hypothetical protein
LAIPGFGIVVIEELGEAEKEMIRKAKGRQGNPGVQS